MKELHTGGTTGTGPAPRIKKLFFRLGAEAAEGQIF